VRLVTRDDAGSEDRTEVALDELVGEGAALVIAGLDRTTSTRALRWGNNHGVAVVVLAPPERDEDVGAYGFVLGASREETIEALLRGVPGFATEPVAPVVDASEWKPQAAGEPAVPSRTNLLPPVSCDAPIVRAGTPRFPFAEWQSAKVHGWMVSGSPPCAAALLAELSSRPRGLERPVVALTLEAASRPLHGGAVRVVTASAGIVPSRASTTGDDEVRRFGAVLGDETVTYWASLGRDAGTLARVALGKLPAAAVAEPRAVASRRAEARDDLASVRAPLWSTEAAGFADLPRGGHALHRTICAIDL
jgi:hypothetical protein